MNFSITPFPLQAPERFMNMYENFPNPLRRPYLAMMTAVDDSVGQITDALKGRKMMKNTVVIFSSDVSNGNPAFPCLKHTEADKKMAAILQRTFSSTFSWMKMY